MQIEINQKQDEILLKEHAKSSFNFTLLGKYEWVLATIYVVIGTSIYLIFDKIKYGALPLILIGIFELIKYPSRERKWVNKKIKENIYNKEILFIIDENDLKISYDKTIKNHNYKNMRECLISKSGFLFKISYTEYYYISFNSLNERNQKDKIIDFLKSKFEPKKIIIKN